MLLKPKVGNLQPIKKALFATTHTVEAVGSQPTAHQESILATTDVVDTIRLTTYSLPKKHYL